MQMEIHAHGFELTDALRAYTRARISFALDRLRHSVRHVVVQLSDLNGPRGGNDKRCQVQIGVVDAEAVVVKDTDADLYAAIDRATERAGRTVLRRMGRLQRSLRPLRERGTAGQPNTSTSPENLAEQQPGH